MEQWSSLSQCRLRASSLGWFHLSRRKETGGPARLVGISVVRLGMARSEVVGSCWWLSWGPGRPCQTHFPPGWLIAKASITPLCAKDTAGDLAGMSQGCSSLLPFLLPVQVLVLAGESLCLQTDSPWGPGQSLLNKATGPGVPSGGSRARCGSAVPPHAVWLKRCQAAPGTSPAAPQKG